MGLFTLPTRPPAASSIPIPMPPPSSDSNNTSKPHRRRRSSHSSKASTNTSGTSIHHHPSEPMARESSTRASRSSRRSQIPTYAEPPSESDSDASTTTTTTPVVGLFPSRSTGGAYPPPLAPTPPPAGAPGGGYSYVPVPVTAYKTTTGAFEEASDGASATARKSSSRRRAAEKAAPPAPPPVPALPSTATKLIHAPPARAAGESKLPVPLPRLAPAPAPAPAPPAPARAPGVLQRVRIRAKHSLERLPRVTLPQRPSITIRIPLPNISLPTLRFPRLPRIRVRIPAGPSRGSLVRMLGLLLAALVAALAVAVYPYREAVLLRVSPPASGAAGIIKTEVNDQGLAVSCTMDVSGYPAELREAYAMQTCIDGGHHAWGGGLVPAPRPLATQGVDWAVTQAGRGARGVLLGLDKAGMHPLAGRVRGWVDQLGVKVRVAREQEEGEPERERVKVCKGDTGAEIKFGAFLMGKGRERDACWESCRVGCLARGVRAGATAVECKVKGGKVGRCWAEYAVKRGEWSKEAWWGLGGLVGLGGAKAKGETK